MKVRWKLVPGNDKYRISDQGKLVYRFTGEEVIGYIDSDGYRTVYLRGGNKNSIKISHLVLITFVGPRPVNQECRHLNGDRSDNRSDNLAWGTKKENHADAIRHGTHTSLHQDGVDNPCSKLTVEQIKDIRRRYKGRKGITQQKLAEEHKVDQGTISSVVNYKSYVGEQYAV
jgi:hypothetical protein